eukprot:TRINITY_DN13069_c0_g3_i1.p1 TRINITY_DN13069_c0_g3~~TRINITY_DN13069_c0_g3_i1.p1  ORF type:complete len:242 (+),score=77.75 TRINITY_DN13069_c0_g3_i1:65-790(+)
MCIRDRGYTYYTDTTVQESSATGYMKKDNLADELAYIKNTEAMLRMQKITDRLLSSTPELSKVISNDAILRPSRNFLETAYKESAKGVTSSSESATAETKGRKKEPGSPRSKPEMTVLDWQKRCGELQQTLNEELDQASALHEDLEKRKEKYVSREVEFRKIIENLQEELRSRSAIDQSEKRNLETISALHSKILDNINNIQVKTSKVLLDQEKDIIRFFNTKINEVKRQFEEEKIKKGKK